MEFPKDPQYSPTVQAIYDHYAKANAEPARAYLGGSAIGGECERALWYSFRWASKKAFSGRMLRLFERGHREEPWLVSDLRAIGVKVWDINPATRQQWSFTDPACGHHFAGNADGIIQGIPEAPKTAHVWECKTHSSKSFSEVKTKGVMVAQPKHYAQVQIYMHWTHEAFGAEDGCKRALYTAVCKDNDDIYAERIHYDPAFAQTLVAKAKRIITATTPPPQISDDPTWYVCKLCDYFLVCHSDEVPLVSCRTCAHATPELDGHQRWTCKVNTSSVTDISVAVQRAGCDAHRFIPSLLANWAKPVNASQPDNWVAYAITATGGEFVNGAPPDGFSSIEIQSAGTKAALTDPTVRELRHGEFEARIVG